MNARKSTCLLTLLLSLTACESARTLAPRAVVAVAPAVPADKAKAAIRAQLAKLCPVPLSAVALDRAAAYLEAHPDAFPIVSDLNRLDLQTRVCRGIDADVGT